MTVDDKVFLGFFGAIALFIVLQGVWVFYIEPKVCDKVLNKYFPNFFDSLDNYNELYKIREKTENKKQEIQNAIDTLTKELEYFNIGTKDYAILYKTICNLKNQYKEIYNDYCFIDFVFSDNKKEFETNYPFVGFSWINNDLIKERDYTIWDILYFYRKMKK